jgi:transcriptional regulator with XRE-family HTH domain
MDSAFNAHLGRQLQRRRRLLGLTQRQLGDAVGVRFQQIQKYEAGENKVTAERLWALARALDVPVSYFFDGLEANGQALSGSPTRRGRLSTGA